MKKMQLFISLALVLSAFATPVAAQPGFIKNKIKNKIEKNMKEKYAEPQREKGREALKDITYENDSRYPIPENPVKATLAMETKTFKKNGKLQETHKAKIIFGDTGECMIMNEGEKNETRMLFDYKGAATYMIDTKEKVATKMPMINFQKIGEAMAKTEIDMEDDAGVWIKTDEKMKINGYNCQKYVYTNSKEKTRMDVWVTPDVTIDLSGNHLFGSQIKDFSAGSENVNTNSLDENFPRGMMIRNVYYEKNRDTPSLQMDVTSFKNTSDPKYFDLSGYEINDILGKL